MTLLVGHVIRSNKSDDIQWERSAQQAIGEAEIVLPRCNRDIVLIYSTYR